MKNKLKTLKFGSMASSVGVLILTGIAIIFVSVIVGFITSFTWNATMTHLFELPKLNIGTGLALFILTRLLFNGINRP